MAEAISAVPVDNAATSVLSLNQAIQTSDKILRMWDQQHNIRQLELDVRVSLQKYKAWQETWSGEEKYTLVSVQALWGAKGWTHILRMLVGIIKTSEDLAKCLENMKKVEETNPRSRWKKAYKVIQAKQGPSSKMKGLQELSTTLTRAIDELWIYSETVFDSLHGIFSLESEVSERDRLLRTALRSRPCSLELYSHCSKLKLHCGLEMDLLDSAYINHQAPSTPSEASLPVFFNLVALPQEPHATFQQMAIESVETSATLGPETDEQLIQSMEDINFFNPTAEHRTLVVKVAPRVPAQSFCLRIPQKYIQPLTLESRPESLAKVLDELQSANLSTQEHLSKCTKVELAFKVVEAGFILLGTPWFASLSSSNLLWLKRAKNTHHSLCLETMTLDLEDLLYNDPGALAETSQIFRLGVLLMEIALDTSDLSSRSDGTDSEVHRIHQLPLVEQSMGEQYCRAVAFCLQYRHSRKPFQGRKAPNGKPSNDTPSRESEKYEDPNFGDWQDYLAELLQQYHSQVYVRIKALRDVDCDAEYRSIRSWQARVGDADNQ